VGWVVALALGSLGAGLGLARAASWSAQSLLFATIDEITHALKIPVIAALATGDGPPLPQRSSHRVKLAKLAARGSGVVAIALLGIFIYAAAVDPLVVEIASTNPVQAYALAIDLIWPL
jgi:hypothetical protein